MQENTIRGLAAMPPPRLSNLRFSRHAPAWAQIETLETQLGVEHSEKPRNIIEANKRAATLEQLVNAQLAQTAPAVTKPMIALPALTALSNLIFGQAETRNLLENSGEWRHGAEQMKAADSALESVRSKHGWSSPAAEQASIRRAELRERLRIERGGTDQDKFTRLAQNFASAGVSIPGVSYRGLAVDVRSGAGQLSPQDKQVAAGVVREFLSCIACDADPAALMEHSPAANAASALLKAQGRIDESGRLIL